MRAELPAGTVTFLFTDVEGSTKLLDELGAEAYAAALGEHRRLICEACTERGGVEVDTQGDAFFFAFPTAPSALEAAGATTEALDDGPVRVRIGLHTGTPLLTGEGYVGGDVHRAARIAASGQGGQVLVSASTSASLQGSLGRRARLPARRWRLPAAPEPLPDEPAGSGDTVPRPCGRAGRGGGAALPGRCPASDPDRSGWHR